MDSYVIGVDIGGTFTDAVAVSANGDLAVGKVLTTPEDFSLGFFEFLQRSIGKSRPAQRERVSR